MASRASREMSFNCMNPMRILPALSRILDSAQIDMGRQNFKPHAPCLGDIAESPVIPSAVGNDGRHELGRIVGPEPGGLIGHQGVAGGMGFAETVPVKPHHHLPHLVNDLFMNTPILGALNEPLVKIPQFFFLVLLTDRFRSISASAGSKPARWMAARLNCS
jgi:hypothetical protein